LNIAERLCRVWL